MFVFILCSRLIPFSCFPFLVYYYSLVYSSSYSPDVLIEELSGAGINLYIYILEMISCINAHHRARHVGKHVCCVCQTGYFIFIYKIYCRFSHMHDDDAHTMTKEISPNPMQKNKVIAK
jgi:hypothetical protein